MATTKKPATRKTKKPTAAKSSLKKKTLYSKVVKPGISFKSLKFYFVPFLAALAVALAGVFWYYKIYTDPQKIFWGMVENNLSTSGFSKVSTQESGSFTGKEITQTIFSPELAVVTTRNITDNTKQQPTNIKLEALGTSEADYQHYLLIDRPAEEGKPKLDYSKVYDMWLKSEGRSAQLINNNLFGPVLLGNLPTAIKDSVIKDLKKAYTVNFASARKLNLDGRRTYSFDVEVALSHYASAAQKYAKALELAVADQITPSSYSPDDKTRITVYVDALSRQIRKLEYTSSNTSDTYTAYGIRKPIALPKNVVSSQEFQEAIDSVSRE